MVEQVDAREGEVGRRIGGLFDETDHTTVVVEHRHTELPRIVDVREQDLRGRAAAAGGLSSSSCRVAVRVETVDESAAGPAAACCRRGT